MSPVHVVWQEGQTKSIRKWKTWVVYILTSCFAQQVLSDRWKTITTNAGNSGTIPSDNANKRRMYVSLSALGPGKIDNYWAGGKNLFRTEFIISQFHNLANRMEDCSIGEWAVVRVRKPNFGSFCCDQTFVCQVQSGSARIFHF